MKFLLSFYVIWQFFFEFYSAVVIFFRQYNLKFLLWFFCIKFKDINNYRAKRFYSIVLYNYYENKLESRWNKQILFYTSWPDSRPCSIKTYITYRKLIKIGQTIFELNARRLIFPFGNFGTFCSIGKIGQPLYNF